MQQNKIEFVKILIILSLIFNSACRSEIPDLIPGNYYESSTVQRWNLKGKVKSLSINNDDKIFEFNSSGYVTKITVNQNGSILIKDYNYNSNGKLQNIITYFKDKPQYKNTETFTYDNINERFVLKQPSILVSNFSEFDTNQIINDLVLGLSSKTDPTSELKYYFVYDTLYLCRKAIINDTPINDTTKITYLGKYPSEYTVFDPFTKTNTKYKDITFSNFGNIYHFTVESKDSISNVSKRTYYYNPDYPCMHIDSIVCEYGKNKLVERYLYNSHMDLYQCQSEEGVINWEFDYKYDSHGNWIKQTTKSSSRNSTNRNFGSTINRVIKYW